MSFCPSPRASADTIFVTSTGTRWTSSASVSPARTKTEISPCSFYRLRQDTVAVDQIVREIVTKKQRGRADPAFAAVPAFHAWRREKNLSHLSHGILRDVQPAVSGISSSFAGLNKKLRRAFDLPSHDTLGIEFARAKNFPQEWASFRNCARGFDRPPASDHLRRWFVLDEIAPDFSPNKLPRRPAFPTACR